MRNVILFKEVDVVSCVLPERFKYCFVSYSNLVVVVIIIILVMYPEVWVALIQPVGQPVRSRVLRVFVIVVSTDS